MKLGLGLGLTRRGGVSAAYTVTLTGLTSGEARQGAVIGVTITPAITTETVTYQWTGNGANISGATTATETVEIGTTHTDGQALRCVVTIDGEAYTSNSAPMRYALGTLAIPNQSAWTVDDTTVNLDASASGANLTFAYAASGLPAGLSINTGTGAITGTATSSSSGTVTVTATDQYGRTLQDEFTFSAVLRTQATGGADLDLSYVEDSAISSTDLIQNWTDNGNTLTFVSVSPALPAGLSINSSGTLTGTPATVTADATYTLTMEDEYGRETSDTFTLAITAAGVPAGWSITDNGDATFTITSAPAAPAALTITDNGDGTFDVAA